MNNSVRLVVNSSGEYSPEELLVSIARVSSSKTEEEKREHPEKLLAYLIRNKHWSPFEMVSMTLEIITSRAIGRQILRHRSFSFQEFSQRYSEATSFQDIEMRLQAQKNRQSSTDVIGTISDSEEDSGRLVFENIDMSAKYLDIMTELSLHMQRSKELYSKAVEMGIAKECARFILPEATTTKLYMSGTVRSWIHFIESRIDPHAQKEIQDIGQQCLAIFKDIFPLTSAALHF